MLIAATTDPTVVVVVIIVTISAAMAALAGAVATIFAEVTVRQAQGTGRHTGRRTRLDRLAAVSRWVE
jgi:ribosomal protein L14